MVILAMPFFIGMIGQTRYILMKCLSLTYYQSQQLQDINRKPPRPPIAHIATLSHWIGKHTTNTTGERIAQMVSV